MAQDNNKKEIRSWGGDASPRLLRFNNGRYARTIEGYAIVFNMRSQLLPDYNVYRMVHEIIAPGAIDENLLRNCDIRALLEHDMDRMLARSINGRGTLTLTKDEKGVKYSFEAPNTEDGNYALEMVKRGDLFGSSFAFTTDEAVDGNVKYEKDGGTLIRRVCKIDRLYDVSIVSDPAYLGTSVNANISGDTLISGEQSGKNWIEDIRRLEKAAK